MRNELSVLIVNFDELKRLPPVLNLIDVLLRNGVKTSVITFDTENIHKKYDKSVTFHIITKNRASIHNFIKRKNELRCLVNNLMKTHTYLWTTTDRTVRELGWIVYRYKHIMQLMELIEDYPLFPKQTLFSAHLEKYAQKAFKVVVPEYNRAHIQKTWWDLPDLPIVLPNKPSKLPFFDSAISEEYIDMIDQLKKFKDEGKSLILYQGIVRKERPLEPFAKAIQTKREKCIFVIMSDNEMAVRELQYKYDCIYYIPFITPPEHLRVTALADIGVLTYQPDKTSVGGSLLNPLYCAPNKIYEYAGYSLPMIGNDVPGLKIPFENYGFGEICNIDNANDIASKIETILGNLEDYKIRCKSFYETTNLDDIVVNSILVE